MKKIRPSVTLALLQARESLMTHFRPALNDVGITEQQWRIIRILAQYGELESTLLAEKACILKPSLTGIIRRLGEMDLVTRRRGDTDQRFVFIDLTRAGEEVFKQMSVEMEKRYQNIHQQIGDEKIEKLLDLLKEVQKLKID
ncbi:MULTISPECIES: homoprotocatechuate degradation operon regulator HpaR [unclassified Acinetobacter]|uniref:homoprotocatechuate degradation operon regulator HpaR n=1 Tax=unclassified Acinetobacter TaxID=196816 RepID=UPI0029340E63|nr:MULTISPECIES: homoprotocatechuate degradation operon regulator HpaR [unclassified Acinetobacter]WOE32221.1 homoprotocatechuate degradation operon regulator HpaR [Acinetobacter sp. SAAs470]WOE37691.1 homoprotocatechuate degradation operon regulator HpaR [Acinetobacter sp. SAAs474]